MRYLVTGTAGFIGFHLARRLLSEGHVVVGIDGITPYYDQTLKRRRHDILCQMSGFTAHEIMLENTDRLAGCVRSASADAVIHLAGQAGVRYGIENPRVYIDSNIVGTFGLLEALRAAPCRHLIIASTSSVYGNNPIQPFEEIHSTDHPLSLYAASKKATEALAFSYASLCSLPTTVIRLFTVYGPWGRPDMAIFKFTKNILEDKPIDVYHSGKMVRDFTYVDDAVEAIGHLIKRPPHNQGTGPVIAQAPYRVVNVGGGHPVGLDAFIAAIESVIGRKARRRNLPMQAGDAPETFASITLLEKLTGFKPATPLADGIRAFVTWYRDYYGK
jgi:UDP-glucuronate 4-epimerase